MLGCIKHGHISANLSEDADRGKSVMDTGDSQQQLDLRDVVLSDLKDKGFQLRQCH